MSYNDEEVSRITRKMHDGSHADLTVDEFELFMEHEYLVAVEASDKMLDSQRVLINELREEVESLQSVSEPLEVIIEAQKQEIIELNGSLERSVSVVDNAVDQKDEVISVNTALKKLLIERKEQLFDAVHPLLIELNKDLKDRDRSNDSERQSLAEINNELHTKIYDLKRDRTKLTSCCGKVKSAVSILTVSLITALVYIVVTS